MSNKFKIVGNGTICEFLKNKVELIEKEDLLIIADNDLDRINSYLNENNSYKHILLYSELTINDVEKIINKDVLLGYINGELDNNPLILYSGNKETYNYIDKLSNNVRYYENIYEAVILNSSISGIHYTYLLAYYVGIVLSKKYNFDIDIYLNNLSSSTPELCEGAYRNIWSGLKDNNSYEEVDDVIHGMEMLVCLMKKTKGKEMIFDDNRRQEYLNKLLGTYWKRISSEVQNV